MLALQNNADARFELPGLEVGFEPLEYTHAKFDLEFQFNEQREADGTPGPIAGLIGYATDLFDRDTVALMAERLVRLLEQVVVDPDRAVDQLDLLTAQERQRVLLDWNATAHAVEAASLPELFQAQVRRTPEAIAVVFEDQALSYAQLDAQANRLAHRLLACGVAAEDRVAIGQQRSVGLIVSILAVLKAGAAYVPFAPCRSGSAAASGRGAVGREGAAGGWAAAGA